MANKMIDLNNIARLASALDSRMKNKIEVEELRAKEEESNLLQTINRVEEMLGGRSFVYLTQAEYNELTEEEKNNDEITYFITDAQDTSHTHDNKEFLDGLSEDNFEEISAEIGALETNMSNEVSRVEAMLGGRSFVYLTQAEYDELTEEEKNDEAKIYVVTDTVSMSHMHDNKEFLDGLNEDIFNNIASAIQLLENNKVDVAKYNDEVPGLLTAKHNHENLDVLNSLTSEKISGYDASIKSLQDNKLDAATYNTDMVDLNAAKHTHENKTFLDTFTEAKYNEIVSGIETLDTNKVDVSYLDILIWGAGEEETEVYKIRTLCQGDKIVSPMVNMATVIADDGANLVTYLNYFDESIQYINAAIGNGDELLTDAKDTVVHCINELQTEINGLQGDVNELESALETVDAIKLNGYSIWVGTTEELNNIAQRDPKTLYFEISDEEDSEEVVQVVQVDPVDGVLTLTTNKYQKTTIADGTEIVFPEVNKFTEIHLYFDAESAMNLTFPDCRWRVEPNIEAGKSYEIVATYNTIQWLVNVIVYS